MVIVGNRSRPHLVQMPEELPRFVFLLRRFHCYTGDAIYPLISKLRNSTKIEADPVRLYVLLSILFPWTCAHPASICLVLIEFEVARSFTGLNEAGTRLSALHPRLPSSTRHC